MIRILIADDHAMIRDGLRQIISFVPDMLVAGEAENGEQVLLRLREHEVDVLVLDLSMPGKSGIALIQQLKATHARLAILVLSMHQESQYAVQAIRAGAAGYITKNCASAELLEGIKKLAAGGTFIPPPVAEKLVRQMQRPEQDLPHTKLTAREFQTFKMIIDGHGINDIARILSLSNKTVSTHKANILQKMNVTSTAGLVHYALKHRLIDEGYDVG